MHLYRQTTIIDLHVHICWHLDTGEDDPVNDLDMKQIISSIVTDILTIPAASSLRVRYIKTSRTVRHCDVYNASPVLIRSFKSIRPFKSIRQYENLNNLPSRPPLPHHQRVSSYCFSHWHFPRLDPPDNQRSGMRWGWSILCRHRCKLKLFLAKSLRSAGNLDWFLAW